MERWIRKAIANAGVAFFTTFAGVSMISGGALDVLALEAGLLVALIQGGLSFFKEIQEVDEPAEKTGTSKKTKVLKAITFY